MKLFHFSGLAALLLISLTCLYQESCGFAVKMVPDLKRAESNYKWFKVDKEQDEEFPEFPLSKSQQVQSPTGDESIPLPLALSMLHEKRGLFDLGTGRGYSGFQAMRGNLGLAFASPGSHGK